jgi:PAS domain S-box-containing protein
MWEKPIRVLLVEDNLADARLLVMALRELSPAVFQVEHVARLKDAKESLSCGTVDVIALDLSLPDASGLETVRKTRAMAPGVPIVVLTGLEDERIALEAMRGGVQDYLVKGRLESPPARALRYAVERRRAEESLLASEERFRLLVDGVKDYAILMLDVDGHVVSWNDGAERIHGYNSVEIVGRHFSCFSTPQDAREGKPEAALRRTMEEGRSEDQGWRVRKDGSRFWADVVITCLRSENGSLRGFAKVTRNITQRKQIETELIEAKEAAEMASKTKDHLLAVVSHELRSPLTPVLALASHLASQDDLPESLRADLGIIRSNVEMESRLIDDLLDMTRIVRNKISLACEVVDAHSLVSCALSVFNAEIDAKGLEISISFAATQRHIWADAGRMLQVFRNVLSNAVKFTPDGGRIAIASANDEDGRLRICVSDTGIGIEPDVLPRLFISFEQGERSVARHYGGLGLGLSICKSLVELHKGKIQAKSDGKDKGTTLTIEFTSVPQVEGPSAAVKPVPRSTAQGCHVLLVEDHADTRRTMARLLKTFGCSVLQAGTVKEALDLAEREQFDLLLSDIGLPDGTGMDIIKLIKARRQIKGIALSGFGNDDDIRRSREAGFAMHFTKPVDFNTLQDAILRLAGNARDTGKTPKPAASGGRAAKDLEHQG